jgi:hypothetical protein
MNDLAIFPLENFQGRPGKPIRHFLAIEGICILLFWQKKYYAKSTNLVGFTYFCDMHTNFHHFATNNQWGEVTSSPDCHTFFFSKPGCPTGDTYDCKSKLFFCLFTLLNY